MVGVADIFQVVGSLAALTAAPTQHYCDHDYAKKGHASANHEDWAEGLLFFLVIGDLLVIKKTPLLLIFELVTIIRIVLILLAILIINWVIYFFVFFVQLFDLFQYIVDQGLLIFL